ncbi:MAG: pilus assembly protein [Acidimicrobiia bacterium]|nr:pilus assembly protein [Acidimicrobiia bacterium]
MAGHSEGGASGRSWVTDRLQDETGAQLLEFAVILPILLSLMFGIITGGVAFSQNLSIDNAARESARYAATLPVDGNLDGWLAQVADVSLGTATGTLDDGQPGREICVSYVYPDGSDTNDRTRRVIENEAGIRTFSSQPCLADGRPTDERRVQILLERDTDLIVFYFSKTLTLSGQSVARFERAS